MKLKARRRKDGALPPAAVRGFMREMEWTEEEAREYLRSQLGFFAGIQDRAGIGEAGWIALKLGCPATSAAIAIKWARPEVA